MKVAIVVYDKINLSSLAQIWEIFPASVRNDVKICAFKSEISDEHGLKILPQIYAESLYGYDAIIVPDGVGALSLRYDEIFLSWIKSGVKARLKISFDLGALILGGAGFLQGKTACVRAGYKNALREYCEFSEENICHSDGVISVREFNKTIGLKITEIFGLEA